MEPYELIARNTVEQVTEEEVRQLAEQPDGKRAYVGYEPSGTLHVGHLLTANKLIDLQEAGMDIVVLLADVHAYLNGKGTFDEIHEIAEQMRKQFLAYGLDEDHTQFIYGSSFQLSEDYMMDLHEIAVSTSLNRAQRAMAELQSGETANVSHVVYPLMQALDIEYLDVDLAVGGLDQRKVHMLAREELPTLGYEPRPCIHSPILADLKTGVGKMSSSEGPTISMEQTTDEIADTVNDAYCPPTANPDSDGEGRERENPVLELFAYHIFPRFDSVTVERPDQYGGNVTFETYEKLETALESGELHPADAKSALATYLDDLIAPGRKKLQELRS